MIVHKIDKYSPDPIRLGGIANKLACDIEQQTDLDCRAVVLGHVQRGGTPTANDRTLATSFGHYAVEQLMAGHKNRLVVLRKGQLATVRLADVAGKIRTIPINHPLIKAARSIKTCFAD